MNKPMVSHRLKVQTAAALMGVSLQFIRVGLQRGILPFGYAIKIGECQYTYYISPEKFTEYTGIRLDSADIGQDMHENPTSERT